MSGTQEPLRADSTDPILMRGLLQARTSRRALFRAGGLGAAALGTSGLLSACGVKGQAHQKAHGKNDVEKFWSGKKKTGHVSWAAWPLYIDVDTKNKGRHPSIDLFEKETGTKVDYSEVIQSDPDFFSKVQPSLSAGEYSGYDVAQIQDAIWLNKFRDLGYLVPLDHDRLPNFSKYAASVYKDPSYDPHNTYSVPWQAGFTGIAYDPKKTGREITSFDDLTDPRFKGKIGMFGNNVELPNAALLAIGVEPEKSTPKDWKKAAHWLQKQKPLVRKYYGQDYIEALVKGDIWVSLAYSGDVFQQNLSGSDLKFVIPKEGALLWVDNFVLLSHSKHPVDAMMLMDFYYKPKVAAMVAEYVNYVTPVPKAQQVVEKDAAEASGHRASYLRQVAHSYAVFPSKKTYQQVYPYRHGLSGKKLETWNSTFEPIYQS